MPTFQALIKKLKTIHEEDGHFENEATRDMLVPQHHI